MTGLLNRYAFDEILEDIKNKRVSIGMSDMDNFKHINDVYGHVVGDKVLRQVSKLLLEDEPEIWCFRYGGDEFVVCFYENGENTASHIANQIKEKVVELNLKDDSPYDLTVSIGIAYYDSSIKSVDDFINAADMNLYEHKKGRA